MAENDKQPVAPKGVTVVVMPDQVTSANAARVCASVVAALGGEISIVVADFSGTELGDYAAIEAMLIAQRLAEARNSLLLLVVPDPAPAGFTQADVDRILPIFPTLGDALTAYPG